MSRKIRDEEIRFDVVVNGNKAQRELQKFEAENRKLNQTQKDLRQEKKKLEAEGKKETERYRQVTAEITKNNQAIKQNKASMTALQKEVGITGLTLRQLRSRAAQLRVQLSNMIPGTAEYKKLQAELQAVNARMRSLNVNARAAQSSLSRLAQGFNKYAALATGFIATITGITLGLQKMVQMSHELSDVQSDVMKTTNLTKEEVKELSSEFDKMNTRTSRIELLKMAEVAGRLGFEGRDNIMAFVNAANQIEVALGKELGDDAIKQIGKMVSIFNLEEEFGIEQGMLKIASAINEIGMASTASEGYLVEFTRRMSGISGIANITAADNIALAGTLDSLGQTAETSSTALNKIFVQMGKDTAAFAEVAGVTEDVFRKKLQESALDALMMVLEGVNETADGMESLSTILGDIGMDGGRVVGVLGTLAKNTEEVRRQQEIANRAFREGTSVTDEYNIKNENLAANIDRIGRKVRQVFLSSRVMQSIEHLAAKIAKKLAPATEDYGKKMRSLNSEINREIEVLKTANLSQEQRVKFIGELNEKYGDYLPNLISEKDTVEDLANLQQKVNNLFMEKIMLNSFQEEMTKLAQETLRAQEALYEIELERARIQAQKDEDVGGSPFGFDMTKLKVEQLDAFKSINEDIVEKEAEATKAIEQKYEALAKAMGKTWAEIQGSMFKAREETVEKDFELTEKSSKEINDKLIEARKQLNDQIDALEREQQMQMLSDDQKEIERISLKYEKLLEKAREFRTKETEETQEEARLRAMLADEISRTQLQQEHKRYEAAQQFREQFMVKSMQQEKQDMLDHLQELYEQRLISEKEYQESLQDIEKHYAQNDFRRARVQMGLQHQIEALGMERELLKEHYDQGLIDYENYQQELNRINLQSIQFRSRQLQIMTNAFGDMVQSMMLRDLERIEVVTRMEGESEKDYTARKEEEQAKRLEIEKKYADKAFIANSAQIIANTAQAIIRGFADLGPIGGAIFAPIMGTTGAMQLQTANAQRQKVQGLERGRYPVQDQLGRNFNASMARTQTGKVNSPTIMVGEKPEYVIDPHTSRHLEFNYPEIIKGIYRARAEVRGYEDGMYPGGASVGSNNDAAIKELRGAVASLTALLSRGIAAYYGDKEVRKIEKRMQTFEDIKKNTRP